MKFMWLNDGLFDASSLMYIYLNVNKIIQVSLTSLCHIGGLPLHVIESFLRLGEIHGEFICRNTVDAIALCSKAEEPIKQNAKFYMCFE